jgi:hypothetical protein
MERPDLEVLWRLRPDDGLTFPNPVTEELPTILKLMVIRAFLVTDSG